MNRDAQIVTFMPLFALAVLFLFFLRHAPWTPIRITGLAIATVAFALLTVARFQLGNAFSVTPQARFLVTRGLYSKIRHPVYVFSAIGLAGVVLVFDEPWAFLAFAVLVPMQIVRAKKEEKVLTEKFGEAYLEYKKTTWF